MCGLWAPKVNLKREPEAYTSANAHTDKVKLRSNPSKNLALIILRREQMNFMAYACHIMPGGSQVVRYARYAHLRAAYQPGATGEEEQDREPENEHMEFSPLWEGILANLKKVATTLSSGSGFTEEEEAAREARTRRTNAFFSEFYRGSLHAGVAAAVELSTPQISMLRAFIHAEGFELQPNELLPNRRAGSRTRVKAWHLCRTNDTTLSQALFNTSIRSSRFQRADARDASWIRYHVTMQAGAQSRTLGMFGQVLFFFTYKPQGEPPADHAWYQEEQGDDTENDGTFMLAFVQRYGVHLINGRFYRINPRDTTTHLVDIDQIDGLVGRLYRGSDSYLIDKDSCMLGNRD